MLAQVHRAFSVVFLILLLIWAFGCETNHFG